MSRVLRWDVPVDGQRHAIGSGPVAHVGSAPSNAGRSDVVTVWTVEEGDEPPRRVVQVFGTGQPVPVHWSSHVGSVVVGPLVWHVFEVGP